MKSKDNGIYVATCALCATAFIFGMAAVHRSVPNNTAPFEGTVLTAPKETRIEAPKVTTCTEVTTVREAIVTEVTEAVTETATEAAETEPPVTLYDVPLAEELQLHIIKTSEENGISPVWH